MIDVRRAYRNWLKRRLLWLVPSFLLSCIVGVVLASDARLSLWVRLPAVALASGVALLFGAIAVLTIMVGRVRVRGGSRRAQLLRMELRPSPGVGLTLLLLLLPLVGVPTFFREAPPEEVRTVVRHVRPIALRPSAEPAPVSFEVVPVEPAVAAPPPPPPAPPPQNSVTPPQILPEIARLPEIPLRLEDLERPAALPVQEKENPGSDQDALKHRPDDGDDFLRRTLNERGAINRAGLPAENDLESWIPPELQIELMLISKSGPWRGRSLEVGFDLPIGRDDSVRLTYTAVMLTDDHEIAGVEPSFTWHRGTVEYARRIVGYHRRSTFDLALMIGMSFDRLSTHEANIQFDGSPRISPWFGLESAIWEDDGVGLLLRVGHSLATHLTTGWSSVTEVKVTVRIDLGEKSSLELGYRIVSARFRDRHGPADGDYTDKMDRSFTGPVAGLAVRF